MQLLIKVKHMRWNILIPHRYSLWHASFWLTTRVLFAMRNLVGWLEDFNLEDWWMSVHCFKACRARAAVCGTEQWAFNIFTPQLHCTLPVTRS